MVVHQHVRIAIIVEIANSDAVRNISTRIVLFGLKSPIPITQQHPCSTALGGGQVQVAIVVEIGQCKAAGTPGECLHSAMTKRSISSAQINRSCRTGSTIRNDEIREAVVVQVSHNDARSSHFGLNLNGWRKASCTKQRRGQGEEKTERQAH